MKNLYHLLICDSEIGYAQKLADYLSKRKECEFEVQIYTSPQALLEKEKGNDIELLLIEQQNYHVLVSSGMQEQLRIKKTVILSEDRSICNHVQEGMIYKYQSGAGILLNLIDESADVDETAKRLLEMEQTKVIGIYSPITHSLKTSFSVVLGQILSEKEETLYLNLEGYSGIGRPLSLQQEKNLSDLIFEFSVKEKQFPVLLYQFIQKIDALSIIPPADSLSDIQCIKTEEWIRLLQSIIEKSCYKSIILDIGDNVNGIIELLQQCDIIFVPCRSDSISHAKLELFEKEIFLYEELNEKVRKLDFPYFEDLGEGFQNLKYTGLGVYARKIAEKEAL